MSDTSYVTDDARDDLEESKDDTEVGSEDCCEDHQDSKGRPLLAVWYDQYFGRVEGASDDGNLDALVGEGFDEPNYIYANHGYYPSISRYQLDSERSDEESSDEDSCCTVSKESLRVS
jgi:hypothetical protein